MQILEWVRFFAVLLFLVSGISIFFLELFGVFRFRFVLNRMQVAATGDTLGISLCMVIIFLWFASPVSSHVIARLEYITDETLEENCRIVELEELEAEGGEKER